MDHNAVLELKVLSLEHFEATLVVAKAAQRCARTTCWVRRRHNVLVCVGILLVAADR